MHTSELTKATYTQAAGQYFQDQAISKANLLAGTLVLRFDSVAFPQKGIKYTGTDDDGHPVPPTAVAFQ